MRITSTMMAAQQSAALQSNIAALQQANEQVTSGKRINVASDDPAAAMGVMNSGSAIRALEQYQTNIKRASSRVDLEDQVLSQLGDLVTRAKELGVSQSSATASDSTRTIANDEVKQLFQQIVDLGNTKFGSEYLFGGDKSDTTPFTASGSAGTLDYTTSNPQGQRAINIGDGQTVSPTHDGKQVFLDTGVLDAVKDLARSLDPSSPTYGNTGIQAAMSKLDTAFDSIQGVVGDVGAMGTRLDTASKNADAMKTNLTTYKSDLEEIDVETAMTNLTNRQIAYQAALIATSKVTGLSLVDYLK